MIEKRPTAQTVRELVPEDVGRSFRVHDIDSAGFTLEGNQKMIRVQLSAVQVERYVSDIEDSAFDAIGIEPRWKSGISVAAVHVLEEVVMATTEINLIHEQRLFHCRHYAHGRYGHVYGKPDGEGGILSVTVCRGHRGHRGHREHAPDRARRGRHPVGFRLRCCRPPPRRNCGRPACGAAWAWPG